MLSKHWPKYVLAVLALILLFHLSPFSEVDPPTKCYGFYGLIETPAGADIGAATLCGPVIWGKDSLTFPFKVKTNEKIEFCIKNLRNVETYCDIKIKQMLADEFIYRNHSDEFFHCKYLVFDSENALETIITISWFSEQFRRSELGRMMEISEIEVTEWHSIKSNTPYGICKDLEKNIDISIRSLV